ncbi:glycosyltransferase family 2 protein [Planococcus shenhongbingii]|uniref:glycosyltransferase family 2 protein n=1 Tax=Planococcus shenhongbingii TaxID=3058398 RepID=UPI00261E3C14|nr:glycosyltransferase family 2 protein [Planococcus sp. N016]WKA57815.1 glycosyltransferase family 2 protein [Planococcus sp. N016]
MKYTIFTPTYNREKDLINLYNSLLNQKKYDFEWLIVDDGSLDNTRELIMSFRKTSPFPVSYFYQKNGGKHRAFNKAIKEAGGQFFTCIDSDDLLKPGAIELMNEYCEKNINLMATCFLCEDQYGKIIGDSYPSSNKTYNLIALTYDKKINGDKLWVFDMDILKQYRFPEIQNENFLTEGVLLFNMSQKYEILGVNESLQIHEYKVGGLTHIGNSSLFDRNPKGATLYYKLLIKITPSFKYKLFYMAKYLKYSMGKKVA